MTALSTLIAARDWLAVGPERWCRDYDDAGNESDALDLNDALLEAACGNGNVLVSACHAIEDATGNVVGRWDLDLPPGRAGWEQVIEALGKAIEAEKARSNA